MAGLPNHRDGQPIAKPPTGFPLFFDKRRPRIVTADPWSLLQHLVEDRLTKAEEPRALALLEQAFDFFEAASNPQLGSRPLLYYYSFLNLVKTALLYWRVDLPAKAKHGLSDPKANNRERMRLDGQVVRAERRASTGDQVFAEFVHILGGDAGSQRDYKLKDLLSQVPFIHRTFTQAMKLKASLVPVQGFELLREGGEIWVRMKLKAGAPDVEAALPDLRGRQRFSSMFSQVRSGDDGALWFETDALPGATSGTDPAIRQLALQVRGVGVSSILSAQHGYRFYITNVSSRIPLPHLAVVYAAMFYLGSVTRYQPDKFDKILGGKYSWVVNEFLATSPTQFLYLLASEMAEVDVVKPYAVV